MRQGPKGGDQASRFAFSSENSGLPRPTGRGYRLSIPSALKPSSLPAGPRIEGGPGMRSLGVSAEAVEVGPDHVVDQLIFGPSQATIGDEQRGDPVHHGPQSRG